MERVAVIIEQTQERLDCLLNPPNLVLRRHAGVRPRMSAHEPIAGAGANEDPLLFTGGGWTELELDLLFDVSLTAVDVTDTSQVLPDVRETTGRFFELAENTQTGGEYGYRTPPIVRLVWGKSWNIPAVVIAVAERLENFSSSGVPSRSWLRMRLRQVAEPEPRTETPDVDPQAIADLEGSFDVPGDQVSLRTVVGDLIAPSPEAADQVEIAPQGERLDQLAHERYGNPGLWRLIAAFNGIIDPLASLAGQTLAIPPESVPGEEAVIPLAGVPPLAVECDGTPVPHDSMQWLVGIRVRQELNLPACAELHFSMPHGAQDETWDRLACTPLRIGLAGHATDLFAGDVTAVQHRYGRGGRDVRVRAYDRLHRLRKCQPIRSLSTLNLDELARELVTSHGLRVETDFKSPVWEQLIQFRQTDFDLLAETAERCGAYFSLRDDTLHIFSLEGLGEAQELELGENVFEAVLETNADSACQRVLAEGWDPHRIEVHRAGSAEPRVASDVPPECTPDLFASPYQWQLLDEAVQDAAQVEALAQAEHDRRAGRCVTLEAVVDGDTLLRPGAIVQLANVAAPFRGSYVLTDVTHAIDAERGFTTQVHSRPPSPPPRPWSTTMTFGVVCAIDDPDDLGRVKVSLSTYQDLESGWLQVVIPAAGTDKGIIALPDIGDSVLVLFARGDPAQGVVLGGLYGTEVPPDTGIEDNSVQRFTFRTPGGQIVRLNDAERSARMETADGSFIELSPDAVRLHATAQLEIAAPGQSVTISGDKIDFRKA